MNNAPDKLGKIRYTAQIWCETRGINPEWHVLIRQYTRVRFKRSQRIGWRWDCFCRDEFPLFKTRIEALRASRAVIKNLYARQAGHLSARIKL